MVFLNPFLYVRNTVLETIYATTAPIVSTRPDEIFWDITTCFTLLTSSVDLHTDRCVNYIKRFIRNKVFFDSKKQGEVTYSISIRTSTLFREQFVNKEKVCSEINEWLQSKKENENYPISISIFENKNEKLLIKPNSNKNITKRSFGTFLVKNF